MRVLVADALREQVSRLRIVDPHPTASEREDKLEAIQAHAYDLANDFVAELILPSVSTLRIIRMSGFEAAKESLSDAYGVVRFLLRFSTLNGHHIELEMPFPVARGVIYTPSVAVFNGKKYVLSQGLIDNIVSAHQTIKPKLYNPYLKSQEIRHDLNMEQPLFSPPIDPTGWSDLVTERFM